MQTLWPYVSQVRGVDVSGGMVEEFNRRAEAQGISAKQMLAVQGDLLADLAAESAIAGPEFFNLDLLTCSMAFHHLDNPDLAAKRMVERLKPGTGIVLIIDGPPDGDPRHGHSHGANSHHGSGHRHSSSQVPSLRMGNMYGMARSIPLHIMMDSAKIGWRRCSKRLAAWT